MYRQYAGVTQLGGNLDLAEEPFRADRSGEFGLQDLDGNQAVVLEVPGEVDRRRPPAPKLMFDRVAVDEGRLQAGKRIGQPGTRGRGTAPS
jgi:hypothetical protein